LRPEMEAHLRALEQAGYSTSTLVERRRVLRTLPNHVLDLPREDVRAWWESRQTWTDEQGEVHPRAKRSLSGEASHVRAFWRWCRLEGMLDHNPGDWLDRLRLPKTKATYVTEGDLYRIVEAADLPVQRMIALGALAGLRSAEIAAAQWEDIDRVNGVIRVTGKGAKDRSVPLSTGLLGMLGDPGKGPIVGRTISAKAVSAAIGRHMRRHKVDLTAHKLRARYATRFLAATGDAVATAEVLGHSDLTNVLRYAVASSDTMRRGAEAAGRIG
jgi:integrase